MSELTLLILRIGFLALLWLFVLWVVYSLRSDLFGSPARKMKTPTSTPQAATPQDAAPQITANPAPANPAPANPTSPNPALANPVATNSDSANNVTADSAAQTPEKLVILTGIAAGSSIQLDSDIVTIGRSPDSTLVIVDEYTSTYHARLDRKGNDWVITDLDSTNGTKVSGKKISVPMVLNPGVPVTIGTTTFELRP